MAGLSFQDVNPSINTNPYLPKVSSGNVGGIDYLGKEAKPTVESAKPIRLSGQKIPGVDDAMGSNQKASVAGLGLSLASDIGGAVAEGVSGRKDREAQADIQSQLDEEKRLREAEQRRKELFEQELADREQRLAASSQDYFERMDKLRTQVAERFKSRQQAQERVKSAKNSVIDAQTFNMMKEKFLGGGNSGN